MILATLPAAAVLVQFQHDLQADRRDQAEDAALREAELLNRALQVVIDGAHEVLLSTMQDRDVARAGPSCGPALAARQAGLPNYPFFAVADSQGKILCASGATPPGADLEAFARDAAASGRFTIGRYQAGRGALPAFVPFGMPAARADGSPGVVIAGLAVSRLNALLTGLADPARLTLSIVDSGGTVLARQPDAERHVGHTVLDEVRPLMGRPGSGTARVPSFEGQERIVGYVPSTSQPGGLYVSAGFDADQLTEDIDAAARRGYILVALGASASLLLALLAGQRFVRTPAAVLLQAAGSWGQGDLGARAAMPRGSAQEFIALGDAFNAMAQTLQRQRNELQSLNDALEARVAERTQALLQSNNRLQVEITEREVTEGQLRQAQKLQAVGQLADGIAHDFNNLLAAILGSVEMVRRALPPGDDAMQALLEPAQSAIDRGMRLTAKLIGFSQKQPMFSMPVDVAAAIDGMTGLLASTLGSAIWVERALPDDLWTVSVDPNQFEASILNLALNARTAMAGGGCLTISACNHADKAAQAEAGLPPGDYVEVVVSDTGRGMTEETLSRAFEPFFTTQAFGVAAGLGLTQVHAMVHHAGGQVSLHSQPGEGTQVRLVLPRAVAGPAPARIEPEASTTLPAQFRNGAILLVDDDDDVREVTAALLTDCGFAVLQADCGAVALGLLADVSNRVRFIIADYAMPGMTGRELLDQVRRTRPDLPFLLITGFADWTTLTGDVLSSDQILRKPFRGRELIARIEMVWERRLTAVR